MTAPSPLVPPPESIEPATAPDAAAQTVPSATPDTTPGTARWLGRWGLAGLCGLALLCSAGLWQKLSTIQEALARQSADSGAHALEALAMGRQAQDQAREAVARVAVMEAKLSEVALQRSQLEELMQSLSRSRDENMVVDVDSALRLAQQQAQLTGSLDPLLAALKSAEQRVNRAAQPRLAPLQRALLRDIDRLKVATVTDTPGLLIKLDELVRLCDDLVVSNAPGRAVGELAVPHEAALPAPPRWWTPYWLSLRQELRALLRVSRIDQPEAALLSPEQTFFLRENLKLRLLNARLGLLARQTDAVRADLDLAAQSVGRYFDPASRKTQTVSALLQQVLGQLKTVELPRIDDTLSALATAAAGR